MTNTIHGTTRDAIKLSDAIEARAHYKSNGALSGEYVAETREGVAHYVIRSYGEVIGFFTYYDRWAIVATKKWSVTTSRHQSVTRRAFGYSANRTLEAYRLTANGTEY